MISAMLASSTFERMWQAVRKSRFKGLGPTTVRPSVAGSLLHRPRRNRRPIERAVDLVKGAALGFGAEYPEPDQADHTPRSKIKKGRAERADEFAEVAGAVAQTHTTRTQPRRPDLSHIWTDHRVVGAGEKARRN